MKRFLSNPDFHQDQDSSNYHLSYLDKQVFRIEDAHPPHDISGNFVSLPQNVNLKSVIDTVGKQHKHPLPAKTRNHTSQLRPPIQPKHEQARKKARQQQQTRWYRYFRSNQNIAIISDFFCYFVCRFKPELYKQKRSQLLDRIAHNYVQLFMSVQLKYRDAFFKTYYDDLAQAVFYSLFFAFPMSRNVITSEDFMNGFFSIISKKVTGVPVCNLGYEKWDFDLGAGNILKNKPKLTLQIPGIVRPVQNWKKLLHMKYSPLVDRYMKSRKYEGYNLVKDWHLGYSLRDLKKQRSVATRMLKCRTTASENVQAIKEKFEQFERHSNKIDGQLKANKIYNAAVIKLLNDRTEDIKNHNRREYANMLVSLKNYWWHNANRQVK